MKSDRLKLLLNLAVVILIIGIVIHLLRGSLSDIIAELGKTRWYILLMATILGLSYQMMEGEAIATLARPFQPAFRARDGFFASCYTAFFRLITFSTGTIVAEYHFYHKHRIPPSKSVSIVALRTVFYKVVVMIYVLISLILLFPFMRAQEPKMFWVIFFGLLLSTLMIFVILGVMINISFQVLLLKIANRLFKSQKWRARVDHLNLEICELRSAVEEALQNRSLVWRVTLCSLAKVVFWLLIPYVVLYSTGDISLLQAVGLTSFAIIIAGVIPSPAGIGSFDFAFVLLFKPVVGTVEAASALLLYRFATYLLPFLIGMVYAAWQNQKKLRTTVEELQKEEKKSK
ncbi:MAG: flippase-like domain-containing protein [Enterococcaceae bacterium]|nr:flippase-like domain-containing protein [Enterococcaceae bacterium]